MASLNVGNLGEYLREQRRTAQLSLRQLADAAGVSNPYLLTFARVEGVDFAGVDLGRAIARYVRAIPPGYQYDPVDCSTRLATGP